tara:strand:- start:307 stop:756 length:450 start_codon:yes stop_codon:yes gene_type:complete
MKKLLLILLCLPLLFNSCKKDKINYTLNFEANHFITESNMFTSPGAYYSWSVEDEDGNSKYDNTASINQETVFGSTVAQTGDWIYVYISVNDVFCYGSVNCKSDDGVISLYASTDNLYINESDNITAERLSINGIDTIIPVKVQKFQIR